MDDRNTSVEWRDSNTDIIVFPVGAMEQHAGHMPLCTDSIIAEYTAKFITEHFGACMLPTLKIATSLEHSGFRGTFSLKPETLMQIVRDIADEAENQNFKIMIMVNGHGGNFSLAPVVRDINRQNRKLKIILIGAMEFVPAGITNASKEKKFEFHSGENETSIMMYIAPEMVGDIKEAPPPPDWEIPFKQSDLNTFGIMQYCRNGNAGDFSLATREKGEEMVKHSIQPTLAFLEDRIKRLRDNPSYSGM